MKSMELSFKNAKTQHGFEFYIDENDTVKDVKQKLAQHTKTDTIQTLLIKHTDLSHPLLQDQQEYKIENEQQDNQRFVELINIKEHSKQEFTFEYTLEQSQIDKSLFKAVEDSNFTVVQTALKQGADVNAIDKSSEFHSTPLLKAAMRKNAEIIEILLKNGADVTAVNSRQDNALHYFMFDVQQYFNGSSEEAKKILTILLDAGVDLDTINNNGKAQGLTPIELYERSVVPYDSSRKLRPLLDQAKKSKALEKQRLEEEKLEKENLEKERLEKERLDQLIAENKCEIERIKQEILKLKQEQLDSEKLEQEELEQYQLEAQPSYHSTLTPALLLSILISSAMLFTIIVTVTAFILFNPALPVLLGIAAVLTILALTLAATLVIGGSALLKGIENIISWLHGENDLNATQSFSNIYSRLQDGELTSDNDEDFGDSFSNAYLNPLFVKKNNNKNQNEKSFSPKEETNYSLNIVND